MSVAPGTSSRTSTPSSAAERSASTCDGIPAKYASVSHSVRRAADARSWSKRSRAPRMGSLATTRNATSPACTVSGDARSPSGIGSPASDQTRANASSTCVTAGPSNSMPVSRHGAMSRAASPTHSSPTHSPVTKPILPSTTSDLRWSRCTHANGRNGWNGLNARTSTPASRSLRQKEAGDLPIAPSQSYSTRTTTPSRDFAIRASANWLPATSSRRM